jgi:hypothetical protein
MFAFFARPKCLLPISARFITALLASLILGSFALTAAAFERIFPEDVKRGSMSIESGQNLRINGKPRTFSGAIQIRSSENMIQVSGAISGNAIPIYYTENQQGDIHRVWILTQEEIRRKAPVPSAQNSPLPPIPPSLPTPLPAKPGA